MPMFLVYQLQPLQHGTLLWPSDHEPSSTEREQVAAWRAIRTLGHASDRRSEGYVVEADSERIAILKLARALNRPGDYIAVKALQQEALVTV